MPPLGFFRRVRYRQRLLQQAFNCLGGDFAGDAIGGRDIVRRQKTLLDGLLAQQLRVSALTQLVGGQCFIGAVQFHAIDAGDG